MPSSIHIDANRSWGGGQEQSLGLALALAARGEETFFIVQNGSAIADKLAGTYLQWEAMSLRGAAGIRAVLKLEDRFLRMRPNIVHIHDSASQAVAAIAARLAGDSRVVVTRRTQTPVRRNRLGKLKWDWCDRVICVSEAVRQVCLQSGIPAERLVVIPDFVDCRHFNPDAFVSEEKRPTVCIIGRLSKEKGHEVLFHAMQEIIREVSSVRLLVVGKGREETYLRDLAVSLGIASNVEFLGFLSDTRPALAAADVFVMPSLSEGLGAAALEAMAMGKPVVASDAGGLPESVVNGETGWVTPAGDEKALAEAVAALLHDKTRSHAMGKAGRERTLKYYDRPRIVDKIVALYEQMLAEK